ncbi:MAG TPA: N-acetylmuramoyl-L-alanine amidase [Alphaproteobacteria bacterium]|nr:N-acetylmuramoyl-L-alanine amidase [Alphaproteobacteria bacterium]
MPAVTGIRTGEQPAATRFVLDLTEAVEFKVFVLPDPYRVVIDLPEVAWQANAGDHLYLGPIKAMRFGLFRPGVSRVVIDVSGPVRVERSFLLPPNGNFSHRFVLDIAEVEPGEFERTAALPPPPTRTETPRTESPRTQPLQLVPPPQTETPRTEPPQPAPLPRRVRPLIALDPGHGGVDPGTVSSGGTREKDVTLATARELARQLEATGRYVVVLTRTDDRFLRLRQRVEAARTAGADLFLSLHADSIENRRVRGASVYTLSEIASDREAAALAAKENSADLIAGLDLSGESAEVRTILIDLAQRETMNQAAVFANLVIPELSSTGGTLRNGHRFAGFAVLKAPDIPSLLIEMGYLSNREDEELLLSPEYRIRLARALVRAIDHYFADLRR